MATIKVKMPHLTGSNAALIFKMTKNTEGAKNEKNKIYFPYSVVDFSLEMVVLHPIINGI